MGSTLGFKIINDIQQYMDKKLPFGPWIHHATITRRDNEYILFRQESSGKLYLEKVAKKRALIILEQIEDDKEFADLWRFCEAAGLLNMSADVKANF